MIWRLSKSTLHLRLLQTFRLVEARILPVTFITCDGLRHLNQCVFKPLLHIVVYLHQHFWADLTWYVDLIRIDNWLVESLEVWWKNEKKGEKEKEWLTVLRRLLLEFLHWCGISSMSYKLSAQGTIVAFQIQSTGNTCRCLANQSFLGLYCILRPTVHQTIRLLLLRSLHVGDATNRTGVKCMFESRAFTPWLDRGHQII